MIGAARRYQSYRESALPWAAEFPSHWRVLRGKNLFSESTLPVRDGDGVVTCFRDGQVTLRSNRRTAGFTNAILEGGYQGVRKGQLVIHAMDAFAGAIGVSESDGKCTPEYSVCDPIDGANPSYFAMLLRAVARLDYVRIECPAVRERAPRFRYPTFANMAFPVPPPDEQAAIVRFLDHVDHRVRRYIRAKQKLIKLLEEQKQAIIHQAVSRGLDPNVRMKPSGVEWLGDVPEHWRVQRLKTLACTVTSGSRGWSSYAATAGPLFIRIGNLTRSSIDLDLSDALRLKLPEDGDVERSRTRIAAGDLLLSITAFIGSVAVAPSDLGEAYVSQHVARVGLRSGAADPRWLAYVLLSPVGQTHGRLCMYGGTKQGLSLDDVKNHVVLLPPAQEQRCITEVIDSRCEHLVRSISALRRQVSAAREFQLGLVNNVVTGKLDVRAAAAALPAELDEPADDLAIEDDATEEGDLDSTTEETDE